MTWQQIPYVRFLLPFLLGIVTYLWIGACGHWSIHCGALIVWLIAVVGLFWVREPSVRLVRFWGVFLFLALGQLGYLVTYLNDARLSPHHLTHYAEAKNKTYIGTVISTPKLSEKTVRVHLQLKGMQDSGQVEQALSGQLLAYIKLDSLSATLAYGNQLLFRSRIESIKAPLNPAAFDACDYYHPQQIYHQTYIPSEKWSMLAEKEGHPFWYLVYACQQRMVDLLDNYIRGPNEMAVAAALILGAKDQLDHSIRNAYADTGAMHVLAVSGLHVGIIAFLLIFLLDLIGLSKRKSRWGRTIILLSFLWVFALISGASPSVLRACTMFSFVIVGQALDYKINIYNALAASAFFLLCINPYMLQSVGFQLSYLALGGIVFFHPRIYKLLYFENKLADWIWSGLAVSLAAQIATLPIGLYYFHQFPVYFWLSGVVVTAAATAVLSMGLMLLFLAWIPFLGQAIGWVLEWALWLMNSLIFAIQKLPMAVWEGFWLEYWAMWAWYLVIGGFTYLLIKRQLKWAFVPLGMLLILGGHYSYQKIQQNQQELLVVYNVRKHSVVSVVHGQQAYNFKSPETSQKSLRYAQQNHYWSLGVNQPKEYLLTDTIVRANSHYYLGGKAQVGKQRLFIFGEEQARQTSYNPLEMDYVLLQGNPKMKDIRAIGELCIFDTLIFDASSAYWNRKRWKKQCEQWGIDYWDTTTDGALVVTW